MIVLTGGSEPLDGALAVYMEAWKQFQLEHMLTSSDFNPIPTTISWKVSDKSTMFENLYQLGNVAEQMHIGTVNERYIATAVLLAPYEGVRLIKIMERRAGSSDVLGLDGLDFYVPNIDLIDNILKKTGSAVQLEQNEMHRWLSLRFGSSNQYEAKFVDHLVLQIAIDEMTIAQDKIKQTVQSGQLDNISS